MAEDEKDKIDKENIKSFEDSRILFMEEGFDEESVNTLKKELLRLNSQSTEPITIMINSTGGEVGPLLTLYGIIQNLSCQVVTVAAGYCYSAGAFLLLMGDVRVALPETRIMMHEISGGISSKLHEVEIDIKETKILQNIINKLVKKKTKIKKPSEWLKEDKYLSVKEALALNILTEKCDWLPSVNQDDEEIVGEKK